MTSLPESAAGKPVTTAANRYPGALPFADTALDRQRFFGRGEDAENFLQNILAGEMVVLFAKSGIGKTSLLNTQLFPRLRQHDFLPVPIRFNHPDASLTPMQSFVAAIEQACANEKIDYTAGEQGSLWEFFKTAVFWRDNRLQTPVLILDQFEEIFPLRGNDFCREMAIELAQLMSRRLPDYLQRQIQEGRVLPFSEKPPAAKVLISLREDALGKLKELLPTVPSLRPQEIRLNGLSAYDARRAIIQPAKLVTERFEFATRRFEYDEAAVEAILAATRDEEGGIDPFLLQMLCSQIERDFRKRQIDGLSSSRVDRNYISSVPAVQAIAASIYLDALNQLPKGISEQARALCEESLLSPEGLRLCLSGAEIERQFAITVDQLEMLARASLLSKEASRGTLCYEISHDRLAEVIREKRLPRAVRVEIEKRKLAELIAAKACRAREEAEDSLVEIVDFIRAELEALGERTLLQKLQDRMNEYKRKMNTLDESRD
jgi:hypothetical protein